MIAVDLSPGSSRENPLPPEVVTTILDWVVSRRDSLAGFDIVVEGTTVGSDRAVDAAQVQPYRDAGATWWIESHWDAEVTAERLLDRIRSGPPSGE